MDTMIRTVALRTDAFLGMESDFGQRPRPGSTTSDRERSDR